MNITPDAIELLSIGPFTITATIVCTWMVMAILIVVSVITQRILKKHESPSKWQLTLELLLDYFSSQIEDLTGSRDRMILVFSGSLFLFILISNFISVIPGFLSPTGSLNTTIALATCVFFAVPVFGIYRAGFGNYLRHYIKPPIFMLPFNVIGEFSRTLALAVRLFGNMMSGKLIMGVLLSLVPFVIPVAMQLFGLLIGLIQAYIFAILAIVYISSGMQVDSSAQDNGKNETEEHT